MGKKDILRRVIDIGIKKLKRIYQISDVHIRNVKRHSEYMSVFHKLYEQISEDLKNYNKNEAIIVVSGDIVHAKTDMSPELIHMVSSLLNKLTELLYVVVISGNHDANLNNLDRLDALTPIIEIMDNPKLLYFRDTGIYTIGDTDFSVFSVFDTCDNYISATECKSDKKIALYHGTVNGAIADSGIRLTTDKVSISHFNNYDCGLLGDIHKRQVISKYEVDEVEIDEKDLEQYKLHGYIVVE